MAEPTPLLPAYLIVGTDRPKVRRAVVRLRKRVIDEAGSDLNVVLLDAEHDPVEAFLDAAVSPGLTLGTRLLLVLNGHKWKAKARQAVVAYLQDPMPDTCVTVEGETFAASDALYKAVEQARRRAALRPAQEVRDGEVGEGAGQGAPSAARARPSPSTCSTGAAPIPGTPTGSSARSRSSRCTAAARRPPRPTWTRSARRTTTR